MSVWQTILKLAFYGVPYVSLALFATVALSFCIPAKLKSKYLRPPYFSNGEVVWLNSFPKRLTLGVHFCFIVLLPKLGKKRGLDSAYLEAPSWWRYLSFGYFWLAFVPILLWLLIVILFFVQKKLDII